MSIILTSALAKHAVAILGPSIAHVLEDKVVSPGGDGLHLVVLDPGSENILYEESFGADKTTWRYPFDDIARAKARLCQRTGMVGRNVQKDAPWLYEKGDTWRAGGVVENGLVVAASGLYDHFDEMIAWCVLSTIQALCRNEIAMFDDKTPNFFYGR